jgi:hypothetical protein
VSCPWSIRWTTGQDVRCDLPEHVSNVRVETVPDGRFSVTCEGQPQHHAVIRDYAFKGSETVMTWEAGDRREFTGEHPGLCTGKVPGCTLHTGHHGRCAP